MLSSISRALNKTPLINSKSNLYENIEINHFLHQIHQSELSSEGIYGIEQIIIDDYLEEFVFTPHIYKFDSNVIEKNWNYLNNDLNSAIFYEIKLKNQQFFPLYIKNSINFLNFIKNVNVGTIFLQVLFCKRVDSWRNVAISQYEDYLNGNDSPSSIKIIRSMQSKIINTFRNFEVKRNRIEDIEQKILSNAYRFEMRIILFDKNNRKEFENKINSVIDQMSYYNELQLIEIKDTKDIQNHIFNRKFQNSPNNLISEKEMFCLLTDKLLSTTKNMELEKPIKHQSTIRNIEDSLLLQKAIQIMPYSEKKNAEIDRSKIEQLNQAFKRVGSIKKSMKAVEMYQGSSLLKIQFAIPQDINYSHISKKLVDIQAAMGNQNITIEIGDKPNTINTFIPLQKREVLYFRNVLESNEFQEFKKNNQLPFIIGESVNGEYIFGDLQSMRHILIGGTSGSGKSVSLTLIVLSLLLNVPANLLNLYLIDPKMVELTMFNGFPQTQDVITDMKKATSLLDRLCIEMDKRYELMSKLGVKEISTYNEKSDSKLPYIVTVIDELADLIMVNKSVEELIVRIAQKGRAAGIHLILATQRPSVDVVTGLIKANMPVRIAYKTTSGVDSKTILDSIGAEKLLGLGDGIIKIEGNAREFERFQAPVLTLNKSDEERIYEELKDLFSDVEKNNNQLQEVESDMDKLKRIIANTGELRVSSLQEKMGIAIGKVTELLKQLVEDEWLRKEGRAYVINVSDEELDKWMESGT
jgi:S-DNA-T family DNA segregation ATPase FtsK/SpoIIIE